jgi:hypothetical protein
MPELSMRFWFDLGQIGGREDLAPAARSPGRATTGATAAAGAEPEAAEPKSNSAAAAAATTETAATSAANATAAAATAATAEAAAPAATSAAATTATAASAGHLHAAANVFLIEDVKRGETYVGHFLFAKNEALI